MKLDNRLNAMTVDVEDYFQVSAFEGVVNKSDWDSIGLRVGDNTHRLLDLFAQNNVKSTFFTLGWVGYDWYMDRRSNYFTPKDELSPFPKNMFVFSAREWVFNQAQPFIDPIYETKVWKWWQDRNKRKDERKRAKRKSVFD